MWNSLKTEINLKFTELKMAINYKKNIWKKCDYVLWSNLKINENKNYCHFNNCNNVLYYMRPVTKKCIIIIAIYF